VSYEEYETSWDLEDQSKRCKRKINCLLVSCRWKRETATIEPIRKESGDDVSTVESSQIPTRPGHVLPDTTTAQGKRARTQYTGVMVQPALIPGPSSNNTGRYNDTSAGSGAKTTVASSTDAVSQSTRKTRRRNRSWSGSLFRTALMLLLMFLSITSTEGFKDRSEITHHMYVCIYVCMSGT